MSRVSRISCSKRSIVNVAKMNVNHILYIVFFTNVIITIQSEECYHGSTKTYNGNYSITETGYICARWDSGTLSYKFTDDLFPLDGSVEAANNYCRDPLDMGELWCPSTNPQRGSEQCSIKECRTETTFLADNVFGDVARCRYAANLELCFPDEEPLCGERLPFETDGDLLYQCVCCSRRGCFDTASHMYMGTWYHDLRGNECQPWTISSMSLTSELFFPDETIQDAKNYCRDPFSKGFPTCITTENETMIRPCGIPPCENRNRHSYDHDCYEFTDKDRSHPSLPELPTAKQLCELQPNRFFMESPNDDYPGCTDCSCCQLKECYRGPTHRYNGTWSRTISGLLCSKWSAFEEVIQYNDGPYYETENYCRDFFAIGVTYCQIDDSGVRFEDCDLQSTCNEPINVTTEETIQRTVPRRTETFTELDAFTQEMKTENTSITTEANTGTVITESIPSKACEKQHSMLVVIFIMILVP